MVAPSIYEHKNVKLHLKWMVDERLLDDMDRQ